MLWLILWQFDLGQYFSLFYIVDCIPPAPPGSHEKQRSNPKHPLWLADSQDVGVCAVQMAGARHGRLEQSLRNLICIVLTRDPNCTDQALGTEQGTNNAFHPVLRPSIGKRRCQGIIDRSPSRLVVSSNVA